MPRVINKVQQVLHTGIYPMSMYSRVVSLRLVLRPLLGEAFVITPVVGNNVWLLGVDVWPDVKAVDNDQVSYFRLYAGAGEQVNADGVKAWENILPLSANLPGETYWGVLDGMPGFHWTMAKYFKGNSRRFGIVGTRFGEDFGMLYVSFQISEG